MSTDRLAALLDHHWLDQEVDGDPAVVECSCGEWRFDARTCGLTVIEMGQHFAPFSEHIAARLIDAGVTLAPTPPDALDVDSDDFRDRHERAMRDHILACNPEHCCDDLCSDEIITRLVAQPKETTR